MTLLSLLAIMKLLFAQHKHCYCQSNYLLLAETGPSQPLCQSLSLNCKTRLLQLSTDTVKHSGCHPHVTIMITWK